MSTELPEQPEQAEEKTLELDPVLEESKQIVIINNIANPKESSAGRTVGLIGDINEDKAEEILLSLLYLADTPAPLTEDGKEAEKPPINIYVSTYGGSVVDMFAIYDLITKLKTDGIKIKTSGLGKVMSAGVLLLASGTKGHRTIGKNCRVMIHNVLAGYHGSLRNLENEIEEIKWLQERYISCLECNTKLSRKKIQKMLSKQVDVYISADEAVEYGIVDKII